MHKPDCTQIDQQDIINKLIEFHYKNLNDSEIVLFNDQNLLYEYLIRNDCLVFNKKYNILPDIINLGSISNPDLVLEHKAPRFINDQNLNNYINQLEIGRLYLNYYKNIFQNHSDELR